MAPPEEFRGWRVRAHHPCVRPCLPIKPSPFPWRSWCWTMPGSLCWGPPSPHYTCEGITSIEKSSIRGGGLFVSRDCGNFLKAKSVRWNDIYLSSCSFKNIKSRLMKGSIFFILLVARMKKIQCAPILPIPSTAIVLSPTLSFTSS